MKSILQNRQSRKVIPFMVLIISVMALPAFVRTSSSALTLSTSGLSNVVTYNILSAVSPTPSYITVNETVINLDYLLGDKVPSSVTLGLSSSYDGGSPTTIVGCTVDPQGQLLSGCSFQVPFHGWGDYLLIGSVYGTNGTLLAQTGIDPLIEPEWK
jgi:hypothetical protein